ncbi:DUF5347 family protein [uncultured Pluralibacter sp.]|uniref:DUF5347 family protein n=1 Tax=uncultured Pluralibacter sp. TaxID=1490864 RepID=UPI00262551E7|nr:DUF5347 family protein [uncultured Pluralibacter sp.]
MPAQTISPVRTLNLGQRTRGLDRITQLRAELWHDDGRDLKKFFAAVRDRRDPLYDQNSRTLSALLFLAGIPVSRHALSPEAFSAEEKASLILAMNQFRAMVSLFPKRLALPR